MGTKLHRYENKTTGSVIEHAGEINMGPDWKAVGTRTVEDQPTTGWVEMNDPDRPNVIEADPDNPSQTGYEVEQVAVDNPAEGEDGKPAKATSTTRKTSSKGG